MHFQDHAEIASAPAPTLIGREVRLKSLRKSFGSHLAVNDVSCDIAPGEFVSILGPSGSGKTTVLMSIAGFHSPDSGQIMVGGNDVSHLPAHRRNIGMVFQSYALFPHMTVAQNVGFPLRMRGWSRARKAEAVAAALARMRLGPMADRLPSALSGGQQQRVALARAIAFEPPLLLMDEPLSALDKNLRDSLQLEIRGLQQRLGITVIFVTHDQDEAMAMSDRIAVMNNGVIEQIAAPRDLYLRPGNLFVANFMGQSNLLPATVHGIDGQTGDVAATCAGVPVHARSGDGAAVSSGQAVVIMVRPEKLLLGTPDGVPGRVRAIKFQGAQTALTIDVGGTKITAFDPEGTGTAPLAVGDAVQVSWARENAIVFPALPGGGPA